MLRRACPILEPQDHQVPSSRAWVRRLTPIALLTGVNGTALMGPIPRRYRVPRFLRLLLLQAEANISGMHLGVHRPLPQLGLNF